MASATGAAVERPPVTSSVRVLRLAGLSCMLLAASCQRASPDLRLDVQLDPGGGITITAEGPAQRQVVVFAGPPWRGNESLPAGRVSIEISDAERQAGAGVQLEGWLVDQPLRTQIPPDRVAALPSPFVFQAICTFVDQGAVTASLSDAFVFTNEAGALSLRPYARIWGISQIGGRLLLLGLSLSAVLWLLRRRTPWLPTMPTTCLPLAALAIVALRIGTPTLTPWWPSWPVATELQQLDHALGRGFASVVETVRANRVGDEPLVFVLDAQLLPNQVEKVAQWARLLPGAAIRHDCEALPASGLVVWLGSGSRAEGAGPGTPERLVAAGRELSRTHEATIWRLGEKR